MDRFDWAKHRLVELILNAHMVLAYGRYEGTFVSYGEDQDMCKTDMFTSDIGGDWDFTICLLRRNLMSRDELDDNFVNDNVKEVLLESELGMREVFDRLEVHLDLTNRDELFDSIMNKLLGLDGDKCMVQNFRLLSSKPNGSKATAEYTAGCTDYFILFSRTYT